MKLKSILLIVAGAFIGSTFPEAVSSGFEAIQNFDYAGAFATVKDLAIASYDYIAALIEGAPAEAAAQ